MSDSNGPPPEIVATVKEWEEKLKGKKVVQNEQVRGCGAHASGAGLRGAQGQAGAPAEAPRHCAGDDGHAGLC